MWETIFVKPVLNLLILIQNYMPGNDLGLAILVFTLLSRVLMWPLIKKQIHQAKVMKKVAPELKKIRAKAKGSKDREAMQKVNAESMAIYKKYGVSPFGSIGILIVQLPLFIAIYSAVRRAFSVNTNLGDLLYGPIKSLEYVKDSLAEGGVHVTQFAEWADLARKPFEVSGIYLPVLIVALVSIAIQFMQVKQTLPAKSEDTNSDSPEDKMGRATPYVMVILFGWISLSVEGAISFYLGSSALVAVFQQHYFMKKEDELEVAAEVSKPKVTVISKGGGGNSVNSNKNHKKSKKR